MLEGLRELLRGYAPADPREVEFRERMLQLAEQATPFARENWEPGHFTASAFVLSPDSSALLLIFHRKLAIWVQPGGHVEPGDPSILDAARREVGEEVGLSALGSPLGSGLFDIDIHPIPARPGEPAHEHFDVRFLFSAPSPEFEASDEVVRAAWVPFADLERFATDESVRRAVRKIRRG